MAGDNRDIYSSIKCEIGIVDLHTCSFSLTKAFLSTSILDSGEETFSASSFFALVLNSSFFFSSIVCHALEKALFFSARDWTFFDSVEHLQGK